MKTRILHTKLWNDNWFLKLSRASKLLFIYLISNESIGLSDIYELPDAKIFYQTGLNSNELDCAKEELKNKVYFYNGWVKIINCERYQQFKGPKNEIAKENEIKIIPPDVRDTLSIPYRYPIDSTSNHKSVISNQKSKTMEEQLNKEFCEKLANQYKVSLNKVIEKRNDLVLYCKSKGKTYKDYQATLQNWLRRDLKK